MCRHRTCSSSVLRCFQFIFLNRTGSNQLFLFTGNSSHFLFWSVGAEAPTRAGWCHDDLPASSTKCGPFQSWWSVHSSSGSAVHGQFKDKITAFGAFDKPFHHPGNNECHYGAHRVQDRHHQSHRRLKSQDTIWKVLPVLSKLYTGNQAQLISGVTIMVSRRSFYFQYYGPSSPPVLHRHSRWSWALRFFLPFSPALRISLSVKNWCGPCSHCLPKWWSARRGSWSAE